jgi:hypothetical protein
MDGDRALTTTAPVDSNVNRSISSASGLRIVLKTVVDGRIVADLTPGIIQ